MLKIKDVSLEQIRDRLRTTGIGLRLGPYSFRIVSPLPTIAEAIQVLYADHPWAGPDPFSDFTLRFDPTWQRARPAVVASVNGLIWQTWPKRLTVAALEWICSWCFFRGSSQHLALHAGAALIPDSSRGALIIPGNSGAGKSTLSATLMMRGWELLSDEIALFDLQSLQMPGLGRPTILKGRSLELIADQFPDTAVFGPAGTILDPPSAIAHLRPTPATVAVGGQRFSPAAFVFPCRGAGRPLSLEAVPPGDLFNRLNRFGINYRRLGKAGFHAACRLARQVPAYNLYYEDAADAEPFLRQYDWPAEQTLQAVGVSFESADAATADPPLRPALALVDSGPVDPGVGPRVTGASATRSAADAVSAAGVPVDGGSGEDLSKPAGNQVAEDRLRPDSASAGSDAWHPGLRWLVQGLRDPNSLSARSLREWDVLMVLANHTELLARLAHRVRQSTVWGAIPLRVKQRLLHEIAVSEFNHRTFGFEVLHLRHILGGLNDKVVLLKGAAYLEARLPWAEGRRTNDVDLLVAEPALPEIERTLQAAGYGADEDLSAADCRYYRRWLHELPPMKHSYRRIEVDVHFRLLPVSDPCSFPVEEFIERSVAIADGPFYLLDEVDRVLHSVLNLARTGEFRRAFRDLWDITCMVESGGDAIDGENPGTIGRFDWDVFAARTQGLRLGRPVACVLLLAREWMQLAVPESVLTQLVGRSMNQLRRSRLYRAMVTAAIPQGPALRSRKRRFALWSLEHCPLPKIRTWLDPLTWTKRIAFTKDD